MPHISVPAAELNTRLDRLRCAMTEKDPAWSMLLLDNTLDMYYFTGTMQDGALVVTPDQATLFVRRSFDVAKDESAFADIRPMGSFRGIKEVYPDIPETVYVAAKTMTLQKLSMLNKHLPFAPKPMDGVLSALRTGRFDLGLTGMTAPDDDLVFTPFYQDAMVLIAPNTPEFSAADPQNTALLPALLRSHPLLLREEGSGSQRSADEFLRAAGLEPDALRIAARLNDQESIKNLVAAGLGLAIVSAVSVARERGRGDLLVFPLSGAARTFYVVTRKNDYFRPAARQFFDFAAQFYHT